MHAAIDCIYRRNHIHHCTRGIWLDWQAQGTRVTQNFFHDNIPPQHPGKEIKAEVAEDLFIEVSHGPTLVDNNIFLSPRDLKLATQGVAVIHNILAGSFTAVGRGCNNGAPNRPSPRYTPYHMKHRTEVAGFMTILHGDCKFYNNIFIQKPICDEFKARMVANEKNDWDDSNFVVGTVPYNNYPTFDEWKAQFEGYCGMGSETTDRYYSELPVWAGGNLYFNGAKPMSKEADAYVNSENNVEIDCEEKDGKIYLKTNLYELVSAGKVPTDAMSCKLMHTDDIAPAFEPEQNYENPDGSPIIFNIDFFGKKHGEKPVAGPFADGSEIKDSLF